MFNRMRTNFTAKKSLVLSKFRKFSTETTTTTTADEKYSTAMQVMHWAVAGSIITCVGLVNYAQLYKGKKKMEIMYYHKSFGLLAAALVGPFIALRFGSKIPAPVAGSSLEVMAAKAGHIALYAFMTFMPITGIAMGYYGGKGLPFFTTTIPGAEKADGDIAKQAFKLHSNIGHYAQYVIPLHVGAVGFHYFAHGKNILPRIVPGMK